MNPRPPSGMSVLHPAWIVATWFGTGLAPKAPGTLASLAALPFAWVIQWRFGAVGLTAAAFIAAAIGLWACNRLVAPASADDPGHIVIDEVAGQWLTLAPVAAMAPLPDYAFYAAGFVMFRFFDILKPFPVDWAERRFKGALGIMADDIFAAVYAGIGTGLIYAYSHGLGPFSA
jgi:phosphatidylglycerophosphatase A